MNNHQNLLPTPPKVSRAPKALEKGDEYYIKTQVAAVLPKYSGRGKGLDISINEEDFKKLEKLQFLFGSKFDANHVICIAYKYIEAGVITPAHPEIPYENERIKIIKIKPSGDSLTAILKSDKTNSAAVLLKTGLDLLYFRLSPLP